MALIEKLTAIAEGIRGKTGKEDKLTLEQMAEEITYLPIGSTAEDGVIEKTVVSYTNNRIAKVGYASFQNCKNLEFVDLPNVTTIDASGFYGCSLLKEANIPKLVSAAGGNVFVGCSSLQEAKFPEYDANCPAFNNCSSLRLVDLYIVGQIGSNAFSGCTSLETIIFRDIKKSIPTLMGTGAFNNTPIGKGTGYIYVPKALVEQYKDATNWINFADQFRAIEDYPEICGGVAND